MCYNFSLSCSGPFFSVLHFHLFFIISVCLFPLFHSPSCHSSCFLLFHSVLLFLFSHCFLSTLLFVNFFLRPYLLLFCQLDFPPLLEPCLIISISCFFNFLFISAFLNPFVHLPYFLFVFTLLFLSSYFVFSDLLISLSSLFLFVFVLIFQFIAQSII